MPPFDPGRRLDRRHFLGLAAAAAAGAASVPHLLAQAASSPASAGDGLVILNPRPLDAEMPLSAMAQWRTPEELFFVRSHFGPPAALPERWTLTLDGEVESPATLSLDEIRRLPSVTRPVTLECAGNGRGRFDLANTSGSQWKLGAVSNAEWTGVALGEVLERARLRPSARHLWTEALDQAPAKVPKFMRSIPREVALGDAFLAYEMNGRPIPLLHGGPLRLIVPGWFGMASTKWLTHLHARPEPSDNHFMVRGYRYGDGSPVERMKVKSEIALPADGAVVPAGQLRVVGAAWTGAGGIRNVEVSADGGSSWQAAQLTGPDHPGAWRTWEHTLPLTRPGDYTIRARATDRTGTVQPAAAEPNPGGYGNNSIHEVRIHVAA